ncbi:MAG TPA: BrnT family toxin [Stellaceae bacterium]|nr:BrnT family toxin [Stellaceae bacterium]
MRYTWDANKNRRNIGLHGLDFSDAVRIFEGPTFERVDDREEYGEIRIYAIGEVGGVIVTVIYTDREENERRIISARKAEPHERRAYLQARHGGA